MDEDWYILYSFSRSTFLTMSEIPKAESLKDIALRKAAEKLKQKNLHKKKLK